MPSLLKLSGADGGGQILRSALTLAALTGRGFHLTEIRGQRRKPGLMRQHLTCVRAMAEICEASTDGAELGSTELLFQPSGEILGGEFEFAIGTAGSTTLLLQTLLPALLRADSPTSLTLSGGTHNPMAPPIDFIQRAYLPILRRMGAKAEVSLIRPGFAPAGGGAIEASITPSKLIPLELNQCGPVSKVWAESLLANLRRDIATRELNTLQAALEKNEDLPELETHIRQLQADGEGNCLHLVIERPEVTEHITTFGEHGVSAHAVAKRTAKQAHDYLSSRAPVGRRLADQLLLPCALAPGSSFVTLHPSSHTATNLKLINRFIPGALTLTQLEKGQFQVQS
mgnify:CR=1 FL=1